MVQNRFYKNVYQSLSWGGLAAVLIFFLLLGYFESLTYSQPGNSWLLLVFSAGIILLFFVMGFYWIFQVIEIDQYAIRVKIVRKTIRTIPWDEVVVIEESTVMKNPAYVVRVRDQIDLNLDKRKKILKAIRFYGNDKIEIKLLGTQPTGTGITGQ